MSIKVPADYTENCCYEYYEPHVELYTDTNLLLHAALWQYQCFLDDSSGTT